MRYVSQLFQPIITIPKNAKIKNTEITCKSQKLLLECGLVRPTSSGLFSLLPLARRSLDKLEAIIKKCIEVAGGQRVSLPALTAAGLWEKTGRLDLGAELMTIEDRHGKKFVLSPELPGDLTHTQKCKVAAVFCVMEVLPQSGYFKTHEEAVADLLSDVGPLSYKQLPLLLYQITNKYRDEHRPKHGLLRAREFLMLDAYGAHGSALCARDTYARVHTAYTQVFRSLQLPVHTVSAPSGDMGGTTSHEWQLIASAGEDQVAICPSCSHAVLANTGSTCEKCGNETEIHNSIEVGHTFILGTKYSEPLGAHLVPSAGAAEPLLMSCYGIGLTRLLAASVEALSSEKALRWPSCIAPYSALIIGPKEGSKEWSHHPPEVIDNVYHRLSAGRLRGDVIIDDRHQLTIGKRLMMADRMGYPYIVVCGRSTLDSPPKYEVYRSIPHQDSSPELMTLGELVDALSGEQDTVVHKNEIVNKN